MRKRLQDAGALLLIEEGQRRERDIRSHADRLGELPEVLAQTFDPFGREERGIVGQPAIQSVGVFTEIKTQITLQRYLIMSQWSDAQAGKGRKGAVTRGVLDGDIKKRMTTQVAFDL